MDLQTITLAGLGSIGLVNVVLFFKPTIDSRIKFAIQFVAALAILFIPPEIGNVLLDKAKQALEIALAGSGAYKLASKAGGI